jgi:hypothetical protein
MLTVYVAAADWELVAPRVPVIVVGVEGMVVDVVGVIVAGTTMTLPIVIAWPWMEE